MRKTFTWYVYVSDGLSHATTDPPDRGGKKLLCDDPDQPRRVGLLLATTQPKCERCVSAIPLGPLRARDE